MWTLEQSSSLLHFRLSLPSWTNSFARRNWPVSSTYLLLCTQPPTHTLWLASEQGGSGDPPPPHPLYLTSEQGGVAGDLETSWKLGSVQCHHREILLTNQLLGNTHIHTHTLTQSLCMMRPLWWLIYQEVSLCYAVQSKTRASLGWIHH